MNQHFPDDLQMLDQRNPSPRIPVLTWCSPHRGSIEIVLGARILQALTAPQQQTALQTIKGWTFVIGTAAILYAILGAEFRKRARCEMLLDESERARETLISNLPGVVYGCQIDPDWTMEFMSDGALDLTGYASQDFMNNAKLSYARITHADDRNEVWAQVEEAIRRHEPFHLTYRITSADGYQKWVWEQGRAVPVTVNGKSEDRLEGFITDVTGNVQERDELERQLRNVQALRTIDLAL